MLKYHSRYHLAKAILLALAAWAMVASCGISSGFLSDSERNSLYTLNINAPDGSPLIDGAILLPGTGLSARVASKSGAGDPAALDFALAGLDGTPAAALHMASAAVKASAPAGGSQQSTLSPTVLGVPRIDGKLDGFTIPANLPPGAYELSVSIVGSDGTLLLQQNLHLFVGGSFPQIDSVSAFPPAVEPGSAVLLGLTVSWASMTPAPQLPTTDSSATGPSSSNSTAPSTSPSSAPSTTPSVAAAPAAVKDARDPWIRWSKDGLSFAEGLLSAGLGKVVWTAPKAEGAYSITAEVFPAAPAKGSSFSFKAGASQDLKVMVIASPGGSGNDFADTQSFYSLLRFDGSFDDIGTRPRSAQPKSFGSPALDTYSSGFGYRFGANAGVAIPGLIPPASSGSIGSFCVILRLSADQSDGTLVAFASSDGSSSFVLGLKGAKPYVDSTIGGQTTRSLASSAIPSSPLTLAATFSPAGDNLSIVWSAEGLRIDAPQLPLPAAFPDGVATLGGPGSLPGIYSGFGLKLGAALPFYRLAERRQWKASLIIAESFEDGALPPQATPSGGVSVVPGALVLDPGASLALAPDFGLSAPIVAEADIAGDLVSAFIVFSDAAGDPVFSVRGTGGISNAAGKAVGSIAAPGGRLAFEMELKNGSIYLFGAGAKSSVIIPSPAKRYVLSLERLDGTGYAAFDRVLVRSSSRL